MGLREVTLTDKLPPELTISTIDAVPFRLPLDTPLRWGKHSEISDLRHVIIKVELNDGSVGWAEAPPRPTIYGETVASVVTIIEQEIKPRLLNKRLPAAVAALNEIKNNQTARGGVDMAIHDAAAHSLALPLEVYLEGTRTEIEVSYILGLGDIDDTLAEIQRIRDRGVRVFKIKVGRRWDEDLARLKAIRDGFGSEIELYADANEGFSPADTADMLAKLADFGLLYCEEPLPIEQITARASLRQKGLLPLIADDSTFSRRDLTRELFLDTFDILNIKTARTGYTESSSMLATAVEAGKGVMIGSQASSTLGTARAGLFAAHHTVSFPCELSFFLKCQAEIVTHIPRIVAGKINTADLAAVKIDEKLLQRAKINF